MQSLIWETTFGAFALVTMALGGGSAWMTGRAVALGWDPRWTLVAYVVLLSGAVRFIHFALFDGTLLSLHYHIVDLVVLLAIAAAAYVVTRSGQMGTQYSFAYARTSPFGWAAKP
jgi:GR25 family glycosyltransferase involved in LPS biosynthesis